MALSAQVRAPHTSTPSRENERMQLTPRGLSNSWSARLIRCETFKAPRSVSFAGAF